MHQQLNTDQSKATQRERLTQLTAPVAGTVQQLAAIKFETFPYTKYGTVPASVKFVSADGLQDDKRGFTYEPHIFPVKGAVHHAGRTMPVVMDIDKPRIVLFANVLSKEECEQLIAFSQPKMQQSVLRNEASTEMEVSKARTD
jgi:DeoR/GlpR family transcriptional regulator of sugar metabolism